LIRDHQEGMSRLRAQVAEMRRTLERMKHRRETSENRPTAAIGEDC